MFLKFALSCMVFITSLYTLVPINDYKAYVKTCKPEYLHETYFEMETLSSATDMIHLFK